MSRAIETIRNIGIVAHIDAGKTTTTERILYYSGASHRMGNVDTGDTVTDSNVEEAERGITIYSAAVSCQWKNVNINLIDTPGHVDFTAEVERSLRVLDGAVVVFSAVEGVEAQSETVWRQANKYGVPRICFINKLDRIGADFERTFEEIRTRLRAQPIALQIPIGAGSPPNPNALSGIIDLIEMKAIYYDKDSKGKDFEVEDIPEEHRELAEEWRHKLLEAVALLDDDILAAYMENEDVPSEQIHRLLRVATIHGQLQPTLCGTSLNYIGVQPILDAVASYLPSPLDVPPIKGINPSPKKNQEPTTEVRKPSPNEPFSGLIFKIEADKHADLNFVRVYSGVLKSGSRMLNPRTGKKELITQLWHIQADRREKLETDAVQAGDIVGVIGPKEVATGDTLCDAHKPILLESITFPETVISMAVEPESSADRKALAETLARLSKQDPTFRASVSEETGQTIISGMGELHLEVIKHRMERDFNLKVKVHKPRVSYRESVTKAVKGEGTFNRQSAGTTQFAGVTVQLEPYEGEKPVAVVNKIKPGDVPTHLLEVLLQTLRDQADGGGVVGYPLMKVKITLLDVDYKEGETTDVAIQAAGSNAFREALNQAIDDKAIALLEPIMRLEVVTPEDFLGNIQGDLNKRRAQIVNSERRGDLCVLEAEVALSQMFGYSNESRGLSQGRASYSMEPLKYDEAPPEVLAGMM
jgi:elongation factor G